ncbi:LysE family transporter [Microvirga tunisiensis]|uniref:LysE family transporter n=2 Tax=Pannonibacter tanglangensis TaxID=2750084 RepID=A0A7X5J8P0_9HYPH|nr:MULTISPECIES: LysE family translocator [unclassified Pannonibacter]NBN62416.1 LysE family transporter [Pannonibacter sp. XCT-34]NBN78072.1 LysE family transporter [Pannonibacter sp. XCT-53]
MSFVPETGVLLSFTVAAIVLIFTPGPDMTLQLSKTLMHGRLAGWVCFAGAVAGNVVHTVLAAVGISVLLATSPTAFLVLKVVGAAYLVWLAVEAVRHGSALSIEEGKAPPVPLGKLFGQAVLTNLLNPKVVLFFVTFLPQFVSAGDPAATGKLFFLGMYFVLLTLPFGIGMVAGAGAISRALRTSPRAVRAFDWLFAGVMGAFAAKLLTARAAL